MSPICRQNITSVLGAGTGPSQPNLTTVIEKAESSHKSKDDLCNDARIDASRRAVQLLRRDVGISMVIA